MYMNDSHLPIDERDPKTGNRSRKAVGTMTTLIALAAVFATAVPMGRDLRGADAPDVDPDIVDLEQRMDELDAGLAQVSASYEEEVKPIEELLRFYSSNDTLVRRVARAVVRESRVVDVDPRLLTSVLLVENPWLNPTATSSVGAIGLMQVMPFHAGGWGCEGSDLRDLDVNICHGAKVFENALRLTDGNLDRALLRYNGCVRGTVTPDCHLYPSKVYAAAGKAMARGWRGGFTS